MLIKGADDNHRKLKPLSLMDGHQLDMPLGEGLVGVFILVDAADVKQPQEAVEKLQAEQIPIAVGNNSVVVIVLEDI